MYESIDAFAKRTGFSYYAIRKLCLDGKLPYVAIGRRKMIPIEIALETLNRMLINY